MENKIKNAFVSVTPDMAEDIFEECRAYSGKVSPICMPAKQRSVKPLAIIAAVLAVVIVGMFCMNALSVSRTVVSSVTIDVNPSIGIDLNRKDKVIDIKALNEDAKGIIANMNVKGSSVEDATNRVVSALVETGYIRDDANSVLVSVSGKDDAKNQQLVAAVSAEAKKAIDDRNVDGAVLAQVVAEDATVKAIAQAQHVSEGKAALAKAVAEYDHENGDAEALAQLSINDLGILAKANYTGDTASAGFSINGTPSDSGYVGRNFAISAAVNAAAPTQESSGTASVKFNVEIGGLSYDVDLKAADGEYKVSVNACTGEIIKMISNVISGAVSPAAGGTAGSNNGTASEQTMNEIGNAGETLGAIFQNSIGDAQQILNEGHSTNPGHSTAYSSWSEWGNAYGSAWEAWAEHYGQSYSQWGNQYGNLWEQWADQYADQWENWAERYDGDWEAWANDFSGDWTSWLNASTGVKNTEAGSIVNNIVRFVDGILSIA